MKSNADLGILIKLDSSGWIQNIYVLAGCDQTEKIVTRALNRILRRSCQGWIKRLTTKARAMF